MVLDEPLEGTAKGVLNDDAEKWILEFRVVAVGDDRESPSTWVRWNTQQLKDELESSFACGALNVANTAWKVIGVVLALYSGGLGAGVLAALSTQIPRAQMATFLSRAFELPWAPAAGFADVSATSVHAPNIDALAEAGITAGCDVRPARYCPRKAVTRAQMATFLARATGIIESPQSQPPTYTAITAGRDHTCALDTAGSVECWGNNDRDQANPPSGSYTALAAGWQHTCGLDSGGSIECWGDDTIGQTNSPTGSHTSLSAGAFHTCGLTTTYTATCWGNNENGQTSTPRATT